jgi:carboxylesterase type B
VAAFLSNWTSLPGVNQSAAQTLTQKYGPTGIYGSYNSTVSFNTWGPTLAKSDIITAVYFRCGVRRVAKYVAAQGTPTWLYDFRVRLNGSMSAVPNLATAGVIHGLNVFLMYDMYNITTNSVEKQLMSQLADYWVDFSVNHSPDTRGTVMNHSVEVTWPSYNSNGSILVFGNESTVDNTTTYVNPNSYNDMCDLFDAINVYPTVTPRCQTGYNLTANNTCA